MSADNGYVIQKNKAGKYTLQMFWMSDDDGYPDPETAKPDYIFETMDEAVAAYNKEEGEDGYYTEYGLYFNIHEDSTNEESSTDSEQSTEKTDYTRSPHYTDYYQKYSKTSISSPESIGLLLGIVVVGAGVDILTKAAVRKLLPENPTIVTRFLTGTARLGITIYVTDVVSSYGYRFYRRIDKTVKQHKK